MDHGEDRDFVQVSQTPIDLADLTARVSVPTAGAVVAFLGTVRNHSPGKEDVTHLVYEAFEERVEASIATLVGEAKAKWPVDRIAVQHRLGEVGVGDTTVAVVVSSPHRADAFEAARFLIDELKLQAPIWKQEHWAGGTEWIEGS
jgi:molybdopterin synthase catalytic subunit